jgi:hypothetical protein
VDAVAHKLYMLLHALPLQLKVRLGLLLASLTQGQEGAFSMACGRSCCVDVCYVELKQLQCKPASQMVAQLEQCWRALCV